MTVETLIDQLTRYPKDAEVFITEDLYEPSGSITYNVDDNTVCVQ